MENFSAVFPRHGKFFRGFSTPWKNSIHRWKIFPPVEKFRPPVEKTLPRPPVNSHLHPALAGRNLFLVDMDDTLFEEADFVLSGLRAAAALAAQWGIDPRSAENFLCARFRSAGRAHIFDRLLAAHSIPPDPAKIDALVCAYREHLPSISPYTGALETLSALRSLGRVVVVTDGMESVQRRKFAALGLPALVDSAVYCAGLGHPKPDPAALAGVVRPGDPAAIFVGDRPDHDLALAAALRIDSVRVRTGRFRDRPNDPWKPVADVPSFAALANNPKNP